MPMGCGRRRLFHHIQGVAKTPWGWAFSRNGVDHGQLIIPAHPKFKVTQFRFAHAGGIDAAGDTLAIPLYDSDPAIMSGHLCLWHNGVKHLHSIPLKPYAAGLARIGAKDGFIAAILTDPNGKRIDWYRVPKAHDAGGIAFLNRTSMPNENTAPRNNICLHMQGDTLILYTMRAQLFRRRGVITQYAVDIANNRVTLEKTDEWARDNALWHLGPSSRFGATVVPHGRPGGVDYDLVRTARNIRNDRLLMRRDKLYTAWT